MSKYHLAALEVITKPPKNVGEMISQALSQQKKLNSSMLLSIMQSLRFLTRQALALRGHNDDESNFIISHYCEEVCLMKFTSNFAKYYLRHPCQYFILYLWAGIQYTYHPLSLLAIHKTEFGMSHCHGPCYDGATNMSGVKTGVKTQIQVKSQGPYIPTVMGMLLVSV